MVDGIGGWTEMGKGRFGLWGGRGPEGGELKWFTGVRLIYLKPFQLSLPFPLQYRNPTPLPHPFKLYPIHLLPVFDPIFSYSFL